MPTVTFGFKHSSASMKISALSVEETLKLWEEAGRRFEQKVTCHDHVEPLRSQKERIDYLNYGSE